MCVCHFCGLVRSRRLGVPVPWWPLFPLFHLVEIWCRDAILYITSGDCCTNVRSVIAENRTMSNVHSPTWLLSLFCGHSDHKLHNSLHLLKWFWLKHLQMAFMRNEFHLKQKKGSGNVKPQKRLWKNRENQFAAILHPFSSSKKEKCNYLKCVLQPGFHLIEKLFGFLCFYCIVHGLLSAIIIFHFNGSICEQFLSLMIVVTNIPCLISSLHFSSFLSSSSVGLRQFT